jgi:fatty acid desaturase
MSERADARRRNQARPVSRVRIDWLVTTVWTLLLSLCVLFWGVLVYILIWLVGA